MSTKKLLENKGFWLFVTPAMFVYSFFWIAPILGNVPISLTNWNGLTNLSMENFIGMRNYINMFSDKVFQLSLQHNFIYTLITLVLKISLALFLAILLDRFLKYKGFFRTVFFFPFVMPFIVVSFLWLWIYNPAYGLLNAILKTAGLEQLIKMWLGDPSIALYSIIAAEVWKRVPFFMLIFLAGLQSIPKELEESAQIDGAGFLRVLFNVIIPQLKSVTVVVGALVLFEGFRLFESIYVMTSGGPGYHSTEVLSTYIYKIAFADMRMGYGSSISIFLLVLVLIVSALYFKFVSKPNDE